jgi:hypothetical protein
LKKYPKEIEKWLGTFSVNSVIEREQLHLGVAFAPRQKEKGDFG